METKKVTVGKSVAVQEFTIIPIIEQYASCSVGKGGIYLSGARQPVAVILVSSSVHKIFRFKGQQITSITFAQLTGEIPEIKSSLAGIMEEYPKMFTEAD